MATTDFAEATGPTVVATVPTELEATCIANALREHGLDATTTGGFISGFKAEVPGDVAVLVPLAQVGAAKTALAEIRRADSQVDWSQVDVGAPEGSDISGEL